MLVLRPDLIFRFGVAEVVKTSFAFAGQLGTLDEFRYPKVRSGQSSRLIQRQTDTQATEPPVH